jgi:hypothetical protein
VLAGEQMNADRADEEQDQTDPGTGLSLRAA